LHIEHGESLKSRILYISLSCHHFISYFVNKKHTAIPLQAWTDPRRFKEFEAPRFHDTRHMKVLRLLALRTGRLYPQEYIVHLSQAAMSYKACHFESRQEAGRNRTVFESSELLRHVDWCKQLPTFRKKRNDVIFRIKQFYNTCIAMSLNVATVSLCVFIKMAR